MNYYSVSHLIGSSAATELICSLTGRSREWLMLNRELELPPSITDAAQKISNGTPLQYMTGKAYFCGDKYIVSPDVLIPQPDTEHIVETAIGYAENGKFLLDLCTGSGCIAIAILKRTLMKAAAVDISSFALKISEKNAELHKVSNRLELISSNVLTDDISHLISSADIITSNPPYIKSSVIHTLPPDVQNEPHIALDGGEDGMDFYKRFIELTKYMKPSAVMILEIGYDQAARISYLAEKNSLNIKIKRDFGGNDRVAIITK